MTASERRKVWIKTHIFAQAINDIHQEYLPFQLYHPRGDLMSYRDFLDPQSQRFVKNTTRRKHLSAQINGETKRSQSNTIAFSNSKAHRMF